MSNIIRHVTEAPVVFIGERHQDTMLENQAEKVLVDFFPVVSFVTSPDGAKLIPIREAIKFKAIQDENCEKARKVGYDNGYEQGLEAGREDARIVLGQFQQAIQNAISQREALLQEARQKVLELVLQVARKVTLDAVRADPDITITMISRVIDQLIDRSRLKVKVHPDFLPIVEQQLDRFLAGSTAIKDLKFEADPRVKEGGCFIETPTGDIDARLESQFEVMEEALLSGEDQL